MWHASIVNTVKASRPHDSPVQNDSYPRRSAACATAIRSASSLLSRLLKVSAMRSVVKVRSSILVAILPDEIRVEGFVGHGFPQGVTGSRKRLAFLSRSTGSVLCDHRSTWQRCPVCP